MYKSFGRSPDDTESLVAMHTDVTRTDFRTALNNYNNPLTIANQPKRVFRFRYASELCKTTHGVLQARDAVLKNQYPSLKFKSTVKRDNISIMCLLYEVPPDEGDKKRTHLSPHRLLRRKCAQRRSNTTDNFDDDFEPIIGDMMALDGNSNEFEFELENTFILKTVKREAKSVLKKKHEVLRSKCPKLNVELNSNPNALERHVCLGFTACKKIDAIYEPISETVFSDPITNGSELTIKKVCNMKVNTSGGDEICLLVSTIQTHDVSIRVYTYDEENVTTWSQIIPSADIDIQKKHAICFKAPPYTGETATDDIKCWLQLIRSSDGVRSAPQPFFYVKCLDAQRLEMRPQRALHKDIVYLLNTIHADAESAEILDSVVNFNNDYKRHSTDANTIFHELIAINSFGVIHKLRNISRIKFLCRTAVNGLGENLLHCACRLNVPDAISVLFHLGNMICALDQQSRTPLHIAIEQKQHGCIEKFNNIFSRCADLPAVAIQELTRLLKLHDRQGYTVLHLAVVTDLRVLVGTMLKFCTECNVDVSDIRTARAGATILHLAVSENLLDMAKFIIKKLPNATSYENGAGETIFQMRPASKYQRTQKALQELLRPNVWYPIDIRYLNDNEPVANPSASQGWTEPYLVAANVDTAANSLPTQFA